MHYDDREYTLTASLELPGVTYDNLHVTLGTCYFNHVKYVGVTAETTPPFPPPEWSADLLQAVRAEMERGIAGAAAAGFEKIRAGRIVNPNLRERKFGIMRRMIQVPGHTTVSTLSSLHLHELGIFVPPLPLPLFHYCEFLIGFSPSFPHCNESITFKNHVRLNVSTIFNKLDKP